MPVLRVEDYYAWYDICSVWGEKNATLHGIRKKYTYVINQIIWSKLYLKFQKRNENEFESVQ